MMRRHHREKNLSRGEEPDHEHEHEDEQEGSIGCSVDSNFTV
jgi:hypothetical protein